MDSLIINGAPLVKSLGTLDGSIRTVPTTPEQIPQHLPLQFIFSKRGHGRVLADGATAVRRFGSETFDERSVYFNHSTAFARKALSNGNAVMFQSLVPTDAGPKANAILWLDILETVVDRYQRNPDGSIFYNQSGDPVITGTTPGIKVKWVKTYRDTLTDQQAIGDRTQQAGDQVDEDTGTTSVRYPIFEIEEDSFGKDGSNTGFRMWGLTKESGNGLPTKMMAKFKTYPYMFTLLKRGDELSTPTFEKTLSQDTQFMFTFAKNVFNPTTNQKLSYDELIVNSYNRIGIPNFPDVRGRLGKFYVYDDNISEVLSIIHEYEKPFINKFSDFTESEDTKGLINFVTGVNTSNAPYESYVFVDSTSSVRLSRHVNVFLEGGSDGTLDNEMFEKLVSAELDRYADPDDEYQDLAYNVETIIYDSGFTIDTKLKLANFISVRRNTSVVIGTHTVGEPALTSAEEDSVAISIRNRLALFPESTYFGTPVARAMIMGCSAKIRNSDYTKRVPCTYTIMGKFSRYMGAGTGVWKSGASPEGNPGNVVDDMYDINITHVPESSRVRKWDIGVNWILRFDRDSFFIPAYKTVYNDDTSILNSMLTVMAIAYINTVANRVWRRLTGRSDLNGAQIAERTNSLISAEVRGKFDNRYDIKPIATVTDLDNLRGFSWSAPVILGADNMKTVMTTWVEGRRKNDTGNI